MERTVQISNARGEAGRQALGLVGRADAADFETAFVDFKKAYGFLKKEFEAPFSTNDVADPEKEPNV